MLLRPSNTLSALILVMALGACSSLPWENEQPRPAPPPPAAVDQPAKIHMAPPTPKPRPAEPANKAVPPQTDAHWVEIPTLIGMSEAQTRDVLGRPAEEQEQPPGKVLRYSAAGCTLSVHLFPDMEKGGFYALDYTSEDDAAGRDNCLKRTAVGARQQMLSGKGS